MLRKLSAVFTCLLFTLGILTFGNLLTKPASAGYTEYKEVIWITRYFDPEGDQCHHTVQTVLVPIINDHYNNCHVDPNGGRILGNCPHPHGSAVVDWENVVTDVIIPDADC